MNLSIIVSFIASIIFCEAAVRHITDNNDFDKVVTGGTNVLVEFYAPWCGHCKTLKPEWEIVGDTFLPEDDITIAAVDATVAKYIATKYDVTGYPTIKFFPKGSKEPQEFNGGRTADSIIKWVNDKLGLRRKTKKPVTHVTELTASTFDEVALDPTKNVLVKFYAPWCGHCKSVAPTFEKLAWIFKPEKNVVIAEVDASDELDLASRFDVSGYPTFKFFPAAANAEPELFESSHDLKGFVDFINSKANTFRTETGGLTERAGRIDSFDAIIKETETFDAALLSKLKAASEALSDHQKDFVKLYTAAVEKIIAKGAEYVDKEISRLDGMINSASVASDKKGGFALRLNVLKAFKK